MMWNGNKCFYFALDFIRQKLILTATNNVIVINKNAGKIYKFCVLQVAFFSLKFVIIIFDFFVIPLPRPRL